jgi:hypothetical protein
MKDKFEPKLYQLVEDAYNRRRSFNSSQDIYSLYAPFKQGKCDNDRLLVLFDRLDQHQIQLGSENIVIQGNDWKSWQKTRAELKTVADSVFLGMLQTIWDSFVHFRRPGHNLDNVTMRVYMRFAPDETDNALKMAEQMFPHFAAVAGFQSVKIAMPGNLERYDHLVAYLDKATDRSLLLQRLEAFLKQNKSMFRTGPPGKEIMPGVAIADEPPEAILDDEGRAVQNIISKRWLIRGNNSLGDYISKTIWWALEEIKERDSRPGRGANSLEAYLGLVLEAFRAAGINPKTWYTFNVRERRRIQEIQTKMLNVQFSRRKTTFIVLPSP